MLDSVGIQPSALARGTADALIERQRIGVGPQLAPRLGHRHVTNVGTLRQVLGDRLDDVVDALVAFVARVIDTPCASGVCSSRMYSSARSRS